jgi:hypothetical protein
LKKNLYFLFQRLYIIRKENNNYYNKINDEIIEKFTSTKNVGKSKPCIFEIKDEKILIDFEKVMLCKIECK